MDPGKSETFKLFYYNCLLIRYYHMLEKNVCHIWIIYLENSCSES